MTEIISLSLDQETLDRIERIDGMASFDGRSELIRTAIGKLEEEMVDLDGIKGTVGAVVTVKHPHAAETKLGEVTHAFDSLITTHLHSTLDEEMCLELFHLSGDASRVREFYHAVQGSRGTGSTDIVLL